MDAMNKLLKFGICKRTQTRRASIARIWNLMNNYCTHLLHTFETLGMIARICCYLFPGSPAMGCHSQTIVMLRSSAVHPSKDVDCHPMLVDRIRILLAEKSIHWNREYFFLKTLTKAVDLKRLMMWYHVGTAGMNYENFNEQEWNQTEKTDMVSSWKLAISSRALAICGCKPYFDLDSSMIDQQGSFHS